MVDVPFIFINGVDKEKEILEDRIVKICGLFELFRNINSIAAEKIGSESLDAFILGDDKRVPNRAYDHFVSVTDYEAFARLDLIDLAELEMKACNDYHEALYKGKAWYDADWVVLNKSQQVNRLVHSFFWRLSSWTDSLYCMAADYNGIDHEKLPRKENETKNDKAIIELLIKPKNKELSDFMRTKFGRTPMMYEFFRQRNAFAHRLPILWAMADVNQETHTVQSFRYIGGMTCNDTVKPVPIYDHLFKYYEKFVPETIDMIVTMLKQPIDAVLPSGELKH
jgi:hypothetical protein